MSGTTHHPYSPSQLWRLMLCPGSKRKIEELRALGILPETSKHAERGTLIHKAIAENNPDLVADSDRWIVEACRDIACNLPGMGSKFAFERRLELKDESGEVISAGTADFTDETGNAGILIDWKTGYIPVETEGNVQLKLYASMMMQANPDLHYVNCSIYQPTVSRQPPDPMMVWRSYLPKAISGIKQVKKDAEDPNAPLKCGEHCRNCDACGFCEESIPFAMKMALTLAVHEPESLSDSLAIAEGVEMILKNVTARIENVRELAKAKLSGGGTIDGWELKSGARSRVINDTYENTVFGIANELGVSPESFMKLAVTVSAAKAIDMMSRAVVEDGAFATGGKTLGESKKIVEQRLAEAGALDWRSGSAKLVRVK